MLIQERVSGPDMLLTSSPPVLDSVPEENPQPDLYQLKPCSLEG